MFGKTTEFCHVCNYPITLKKGASLPPVCPVCEANLANRAEETLVSTFECEHLKGAIGAGDGFLYATNKRLFFIKAKKSADVGGGDYDDDSEYGYGAGANAAIAGILSKGAGKISVNVPLEDIGSMEDCKKGLRKGVTLHTKSGEAYNFFMPIHLGKVEALKDFLTPYIGG